MPKIVNAPIELEDGDVQILTAANRILDKLPSVLHTEHTATEVGQTFHTLSAIHVLDAILSHERCMADEADAAAGTGTEHIG